MRVGRVRRGRRNRLTWVALGAALALWLGAPGCGRKAEVASEAVLWVPGGIQTPLRGGFSGGAVSAARDGATWIAAAESSPSGSHVRVLRLPAPLPQREGDAPPMPRPVAAFAGSTPGIAVDASGLPLVVYAVHDANAQTAIVGRRGDADGRTWSEALPIASSASVVATPGRLVFTRRQGWVLTAEVDGTPVAFASADGRQWTRVALAGWPAGARAPAIVETSDGTWHGFALVNDALLGASSSDGGATWSGFATVHTGTAFEDESGFAAAPTRAAALAPGMDAGAGAVLLAWTDAPGDTRVANPRNSTLRLGWMVKPGASLTALTPIARRAGEAIVSPALSDGGDGSAVAWCTFQRSQSATAMCVRIVPETRQDAAPDSIAALDLWAQHVLARPAPSQRLFIEGYCMRGLVAAQSVLAAHPSDGAWLRVADVERGILQARSFADWMVAGQDTNGYWPLGYKAVYAADMAAVVGLYATLAPHVDAATLERFTASAHRFAAALERDGLLLANGACAVGWMATRDRAEAAALREPYLVSTALAGVATHAWLYARTREPEFARRARAALDYTLAAIGPDGALPRIDVGDVHEGPYLAAAYVQEGWMAADRHLGDDAVRAQLRRALRPHVDWLLRTQRPDGTWGEQSDGESARAIAIPNFLVWYERRCESRADVRAALHRAAAGLANPDRWFDLGLSRAGKHEDVQRALAGRTLAALAGGEPVH